jgi:hypothetical protein
MANVNPVIRGERRRPVIEHTRNEYPDLNFDLEPHREAIAVMVSYGFSRDTIGASLIARDLIHVRVKTGRFIIGLAADLREAEESPLEQRCIAREVVYQSPDAHAAELVRREVEGYFLRHFLGRCIASPQGSGSMAAGEKLVYVALFAPSS